MARLKCIRNYYMFKVVDGLTLCQVGNWYRSDRYKCIRNYYMFKWLMVLHTVRLVIDTDWVDTNHQETVLYSSDEITVINR